MSGLCSLFELRFAMWWGAGRRRLRRQSRAACMFIFFLMLLLNTMSQVISTGGQEPVHVREDSHSSLIVGGRGGGGQEEEQQQLSRLGSRPPFCERKCGGCAPCTAVQVRAGAAEGQLSPQCANYEPVGWKCKCGAAVFDP
ncbi:hypothetical protein EJB05_31017 [Eragrostis curvula]|uniref:Epidermal patterning factor-like protein n=1 Tax=Eragrostis curvula TaxID=38414 RepID=A0A5J9UDF9_9POAL|nr:hypothetical protein EJB05_31017 [Eragrostis curvula]